MEAKNHWFSLPAAKPRTYGTLRRIRSRQQPRRHESSFGLELLLPHRSCWWELPEAAYGANHRKFVCRWKVLQERMLGMTVSRSVLAALSFVCPLTLAAQESPKLSFVNDVVPIFTMAACAGSN